MVISYEKIGNIRRLIRAHRIKTSHNMKPHNYSCAMAINPNMLGQFRTHCNYYTQNSINQKKQTASIDFKN